MKLRLISLFVALAMFVVQVPVVIAQGASNWSTVQATKVDERLIVKKKDGKTIEGRMIEASETNLTISRDNKVVNISRSDIREIYHSTGKAAKSKWALIGTGFGAGAGAGLGAIKYDSNRDDYVIYPVMGFIIGAGVGAVTGLAFGASRRSRNLIYQVP
jgi:uncharacterized membrane protein